MVVSLARCKNVKMVPFDVVTGVFNVISNGRRVIIFQKGLEMFRFPVVESGLCKVRMRTADVTIEKKILNENKIINITFREIILNFICCSYQITRLYVNYKGAETFFQFVPSVVRRPHPHFTESPWSLRFVFPM